MSKHFWFVAAGSGGHIFPGIAVADELQKITSNTSTFLFWGDKRRLEARLIPEAGYRIRFLKVEQWKGKGLLFRFYALLRLALSFVSALIESFKKKPNALVSVGGYVSVPVALVAKFRSIPVYIIEPNTISGVANVLVSGWARKAFVSSLPEENKKLKCEILKTGSPIRKGLKSNQISQSAKNILVIGGSQGAKALSLACVEVAREFKKFDKNLRWVIQAGESNYEHLAKAVQTSHLEECVIVKAFISDMNSAYSNADVLVSRAGASTLSELFVIGIPSVLVPFPFAADDHQRVNSRALEKEGAALVVDEQDENFVSKLSATLKTLIFSEKSFQKRIDMQSKLSKLGRPEATHTIASQICKET